MSESSDSIIDRLVETSGGHRCSDCGSWTSRAGRYCSHCHASYMREWRKTHALSKEQAKRSSARSFALVYKKRGTITQENCRACGSPDSEMHHIDYEQPLAVIWLCRECHLSWHAFWKESAVECFSWWIDLRQKIKATGDNNG